MCIGIKLSFPNHSEIRFCIRRRNVGFPDECRIASPPPSPPAPGKENVYYDTIFEELLETWHTSHTENPTRERPSREASGLRAAIAAAREAGVEDNVFDGVETLAVEIKSRSPTKPSSDWKSVRVPNRGVGY